MYHVYTNNCSVECWTDASGDSNKTIISLSTDKNELLHNRSLSGSPQEAVFADFDWLICIYSVWRYSCDVGFTKLDNHYLTNIWFKFNNYPIILYAFAKVYGAFYWLITSTFVFTRNGHIISSIPLIITVI